VGDAPSFRYGQTFITHRAGFREVAETIAERLPVRGIIRQVGYLGENIDLRLLLVRDFAHAVSGKGGSNFYFPGDLLLDEGLSIAISNDNSVRGIADRARNYLQTFGAHVVLVNDAEHHSYPRTTVYYRAGRLASARRLADVLPLTNIPLRQSDQLYEYVDA